MESEPQGFDRGFDGAACAASTMLKRHEALSWAPDRWWHDDASCSKSEILPRPLFLPSRVGSDRCMSVLAWLIAPSLVLPTLEQGAG